MKKIVYHLNKRKKLFNELVEGNIKEQVQKVFVVKRDKYIMSLRDGNSNAIEVLKNQVDFKSDIRKINP